MKKSKKCGVCREEKNLEDFCFNSRKSDGRNYRCKKCDAEASRKYYRKNKDRVWPTRLKWQRNNRDKCAEYQTRCRHKDPNRVLAHRMRNRLYAAVRAQRTNKNNKTFDLVGLPKAELLEYLKGTMPKDATMQDFMEGRLHIDHIIPVSKFDLTKEEELRKAFNYKNLQLLWAKENRTKKDKISEVPQIPNPYHAIERH